MLRPSLLPCCGWNRVSGAGRRTAALARVVTIQVKPEEMEACISIFREVNAPSIAVRPGFDHGHWWVDHTSGEATSVTFWENEQDERASRANIPRLIEGMRHVAEDV